MKNIHILPTDKPSRLQINRHGTLFLSTEAKVYSDCTNQYMYITNNEKIKDVDCFIGIKVEEDSEDNSFVIVTPVMTEEIRPSVKIYFKDGLATKRTSSFCLGFK